MRLIKVHNVIAASLLAASTVLAPAIAHSATISVRVAPPAYVETAPAPRPGYVWSQGYYRWDGHRHVKTNGHWVRERHGYNYVGPHWAQRNNQWHFNDGHWARVG